MDGENVRGPEKARRLDAWIARECPGTSPFVWAYGDSSGDTELWARADGRCASAVEPTRAPADAAFAVPGGSGAAGRFGTDGSPSSLPHAGKARGRHDVDADDSHHRRPAVTHSRSTRRDPEPVAVARSPRRLRARGARVTWVLVARRDFALHGDDFFYHWQANALADGMGFLNPLAWKALGRIDPSGAHPPLYSMYLAVVSWFGGTTPLVHRLASCVLGAGGVVLSGSWPAGSRAPGRCCSRRSSARSTPCSGSTTACSSPSRCTCRWSPRPALRVPTLGVALVARRGVAGWRHRARRAHPPEAVMLVRARRPAVPLREEHRRPQAPHPRVPADRCDVPRGDRSRGGCAT